MIGVTNDEKVFYGSLEKTTVRKARTYTIEQKRKKRKKKKE
jgi:hypothetical protein